MTNILVIEDEYTVRANIVELLEAEDYHVVSAENGFLGALWAQEHIPDLVICDVMMPEINGHDVLTALRQNPMTATIPFIFLTAYADKADIRQGMQLGADDYLTKPFTRDELLGAIATRLAKHEVVMQQYTAEQKRAEALQKKLTDLQQHLDSKENILQQFQQELNSVLPKIGMAIYLLKKLQPGQERDRCLALLQKACSEEVSLLKQIPDLQNILTDENAKLLRQLNLIT